MSDTQRRLLLERLIRGELPGADATRQLAAFGWDVDEPVATLSIADAERMLLGFLDGTRKTDVLVAWADALEVREDVEVDAPVQELLVFLANPEINRPLTTEAASQWLDRLQRDAPS